MVAVVIGGSTHPDASCVRDEATLRAALDPALDGSSRRDLPPLFQLRTSDYHRGQQHLLVGIHDDRGVLWWSHPEAHESLISTDGNNPDDVLYHLDTGEIDFPARAELPVDAVLDAAAEFQRTGQRPTNIAWISEDRAWTQQSTHTVRHAS